MLREWLHPLIDLLLPIPCAVCGKTLLKGESVVCTYCIPKFPETGFQTSLTDNLLFNNWPVEPKPDGVFALWNFQTYGPVQSLLHSLKYQNRPEVGFWAGKVLGSVIKEDLTDWLPEGIAFVPLHPKRLKERGYNQAEKIAEGVGEALQIPVLVHLLKRSRYTETQTHKDRANRLVNISEAISLNLSEKVPNSVLLVDDVITTGATLSACHKVLVNAGCKKVWVASLAWAQSG